MLIGRQTPAPQPPPPTPSTPPHPSEWLGPLESHSNKWLAVRPLWAPAERWCGWCFRPLFKHSGGRALSPCSLALSHTALAGGAPSHSRRQQACRDGHFSSYIPNPVCEKSFQASLLINTLWLEFCGCFFLSSCLTFFGLHYVCSFVVFIFADH